MKTGIISKSIEGFCKKELKVVDCNGEKSNQHEFNVNKGMRELLGNTRKHFTNSYWVYMSDYEIVKANDTLSWYDARENHPSRSEWRLYYGGNDVVDKAKEGDWLYILRVSEDYLVLVIIEKESKNLDVVKYLLGEEINIGIEDNDKLDSVYNLISEIISRTQEREQEKEEEEALDEAENYDVVDNVFVRNTMLQISFNSLIRGIEQGDYIIPGFQRFYRWKEEQAENLAVSFMRGMPIPPIYCYRNKKHQLVILDGQQRVLSLYLYYKGQYFKRKRNASADLRTMDECENNIPEALKHYEMKEKNYFMNIRNEKGEVERIDITYKNLSKEARRQLDYFTLTIISIDIDKDKYREVMLHKIFANLNTGGTPLSNQELRNGIYFNKFYIMLFNLNRSNTKWRLLYGGSSNSKENKKSKDVELLLRMCAFFYYTTLEGEEIRIANYKDNMSLFLDEFSVATDEFSDDTIESYKKRLEDFFDYMEDASGKNKYSGLVAFFVAWNLLNKKCNITSENFGEITENDEYKNTIISHASGKNNIEKRFKHVYQAISKLN